MILNLSRNLTKKLKLFGISFVVFSSALSLMILLPNSLDLAESKINSRNEVFKQPILLAGDVQAESTQSSLQKIDLNIKAPTTTANSVYIKDLTTGDILFKKNSETRVPMASTTKIMTALVATEHFKSGDILLVPPEALVGGSNMGLIAGEYMTFRSLLYGMLLNSGNDAAFTVAANYPGGIYEFVNAMNQKAGSLGLKNTNFDNPYHYTSSEDMAEIATEFTKHPTLSKVVSTKETSVISFDKTKSHPLKNLNKLLGTDGVVGIKTGFTEIAGENLVALVDRDGHKILTVVLNSNDRFGESKALIDWVFKNFKWE